MIHLVDLFSGIGGVSSGAAAAGWHVMLSVDCWGEAQQVHQQVFPDTRHMTLLLGDEESTKLLESTIDELSRIHVNRGDSLHIHASPPCQALSRINRHTSSDKEGMRLVEWAFQFLTSYKSTLPFDVKVTWSIEQVIHCRKARYDKHVTNFISDSITPQYLTF